MSLDTRFADTATAIASLLSEVRVDSATAVDALPAEELLELLRRVGDLHRVADSLGAVAAASVARRLRGDPDFCRVALGGDAGARAASELIRELTRVDDDTVRAWETVGDAIAPRSSLQGEPLPPRHEPIAGAVLDGAVGARAAAIIARGIDRIADHADVDTRAAVEETLVEYTGSLTTRELTRAVRSLPDRFDPDGAEPREEHLRRLSKVTIRQLPGGLTRLIADLHPEAAGFIAAALDARTAPRRRVAFTDDPGIPGPEDADHRTLAQKRVDALAGIARDALRADPGTLAGTAVTMLVTVPLEALRTGLGAAQIAGVDEPLSAATARRLAADAELIPVVLGADSEPLDLGRTSRLFSEAQRRAMVVRDGGCVWPGCPAPPAWCEAAHLNPWLPHGPTDLDNGALMCAHHHHRFDRDGWRLRRDRGVPYLIPPGRLDPARTPRRAGRIPIPV